MESTNIKTDVLVIGGGVAGLNAAIAAAEKGASVVVMDKGKIERSGSVGGGVDHFTAFLNQGEDWDTRDAFLEWVWQSSQGTGDPAIIDAVYCSELDESIKRLHRIGVPLTQPDGTFYRTQAFAEPGPYEINFNGKRIKPCLAKEVRGLGCTVLDKVMAIDLLTKDGMVVGGVGFSIRSGEFYTVEAKATIAATGYCIRLYENPRINPFNTWLCPFDTGDTQVMALRAGATLTNMEFMQMNLVPKGFSASGFNALVGMGGRFKNSLGEYYMEKYHSFGNRAPRSDAVFYSLIELKEGRGPIFIDCTHLGEKELKHLNEILGYDKDTLPDYLAQRGENLKEKPLEISVSEGMQMAPGQIAGSGIKIDKNCASTVPGLFVAGDCADHNRSLSPAVTGGYHAGKAAADYALKTPSAAINITQVEEGYHEFAAPLRRKEEGITYTELENMLRKVMYENVGTMRTAMGLKFGLAKIRRLKEYVRLLKAEDYHQLMRVHEAKSLLEVGEMMAEAALYREESRAKPYHYRLDFPERDDEHWCGQVNIKSDAGKIVLSFQKLAHK